MEDFLGAAIKYAPSRITRITSRESLMLEMAPFVGGTTLPPAELIMAFAVMQHGVEVGGSAVVSSRSSLITRILARRTFSSPDARGYY